MNIRITREDNGIEGRFVAHDGDTFAGEMTYRWVTPAVMAIDHTGVEPEYDGHGVGKHLVDAAVVYARANDVKILPLCSFANSVMQADPSMQDVMVELP